MNMSDKSIQNNIMPDGLHALSRHSFWRDIDIRFPWLKLVAVLVVGAAIILDLLDCTISRVHDPYDKIRIVPMFHHQYATDRHFEGKKLIALTFDDGPSPDNTPVLLDRLLEKDVLATFFMLGSRAREYPDLVKRVEREHHVVASHTMYHQNLVRIPAKAAKADIDGSVEVFKSILGHAPAYTRLPYGNSNDVVRGFVSNPIILWSVDPLDWKEKSPDLIISTVRNQAHDGAIILMHDIYPSTIEAVPSLIDALRGDGYEFVTISELAQYRGIKLIPREIYYNITP